MTTRRFFRRVWQFNALAIAGVSVFGLLLGAYALFETTRHVFRDRTVQTLARVPATGEDRDGAGTVPAEAISFGRFSKLRGHDIFWAPINSKQSYRLQTYSKHAYSIRNYAFYNATTGENRRLLKSNRAVIASALPLAKDAPDRSSPITAILYEVIRNDTDSDGALTSRDKRDLVFSKPDGGGAVTAVEGIETLLGHSLLAPDVVVTVYTRNGRVTAEHFSASTFQSTEQKVIEPQQSTMLGRP